MSYTHEQSPIARQLERVIQTMVLVTLAELEMPSAAAADDDIVNCARQKVTFDGIKPLKYADVIGDAGSHVALSHQHPALCKSTNTECAGKAYVVPGDSVAVANTCGDYAQVQFIGEKTVSYGWVEATHLKEHSAPAHSVDMTPHAAEGSNLSTQRYPFKLLKGHGVPVCEAYLQRLNQTPFPNLPSCGRPENNEVPGFAWLNRVWVSDEELNKLFNPLNAFVNNTLPEPASHQFYKGPFASFRYDPKVDIDNDGVSDNLFIYDGDNRDRPQCGNYWRGDVRVRGDAHAVILTDRGDQVDKEKTINVFSRSGPATLGDHLPLFASCEKKLEYCPIGKLVGIFKYRSLNYFDTFYDNDLFGDFSGHHHKRENLNDTLAVLLNQQGQTQEICTYYLMDDKQGK